MLASTLLLPAFALAFVTFCVWLSMIARRGVHMQKHKIDPEDMPTRTLADQKFGDAQAPNNALMNLFELPVLFYVLMVLLVVLSKGDWLFLMLAWAFVALRAVQAAIHISYNRVLHRGAAYLASCVVLWIMWARFAITLYL